MRRQGGTWVLIGHDRAGDASPDETGDGIPGSRWSDNVFSVVLFVCDTCGQVELVDTAVYRER